MSLESWKAEFDSVPARDVPREEAVAHSLRKWQGLLLTNLERHDVYSPGGSLLVRDRCSDDAFGIDADSCALCTHYLRGNSFGPGRERARCVDCPLHRALGCDCDLGDRSPWRQHCRDGCAQPMIDALEQAALVEAGDRDRAEFAEAFNGLLAGSLGEPWTLPAMVTRDAQCS